MLVKQEAHAWHRLVDALEARLDHRAVEALDEGEIADTAAAMASMLPRHTSDPWDDLLGPFYDAAAVRRILGVGSRQAVDGARRGYRIVGIRTRDGRWAYPTFQFVHTGRELRVAEGLAEVLSVLMPSADGLAAARWMATRNRKLKAKRPVDLLRATGSSDEVLSAARTQAARWDDESRL